ncbi:MAG: rhomboid family intramembrane serine protease [Brevefilum sp.]
MSDAPNPQETSEVRQPVRVKLPNNKPVVTYILIGFTALMYILQVLVESSTGSDLLFLFGGKINPLIMDGQVWRFITPVLLHGSILHIAFNMYALYVIGQRLEQYYGHSRFLLLYLLSGFAGNVLSFVLTPNPSLGASTAVFGLLAAEGIFIFQNRNLFGPVRTRQSILNLAVIFMINLTYGFMPGTNIDNMGHIGGAIGGIFFAWKAGPLLKITGEPPFLDVTDVRRHGEVITASLVVFLGFTIIALIPFFTS